MIVDDDVTFRSSLADLLKGGQDQVNTESFEAAKSKLGIHSDSIPDLILVRNAENESKVQQINPKLQVLCVTPNIAGNLNTLKQMVSLALENHTLRTEIEDHWGLGTSQFVGKSQPMQRVFDLVKRVSQTHAHVLITGPQGSGKESIARAIHSMGDRRGKNFVVYHCGGSPEKHTEGDLFRPGGFFEQAQGGTLYLEDMGNLNVALQARLIKALQDQKPETSTEVRVIASSQDDLKKALETGKLREDLYYRLSVIQIEVPSLSERTEDIPLLSGHFLKKYTALNRSPATHFSTGAMKKLMSRSWTGNVRELESAIERAVVLSTSSEVAENEIADAPHGKPGDKVDFILNTLQEDYPTVGELEKRYMKIVLEKTKGRKEKAAKILGINRRTLYRKEREYGWVSENEEVNPAVSTGAEQPKIHDQKQS